MHRSLAVSAAGTLRRGLIRNSFPDCTRLANRLPMYLLAASFAVTAVSAIQAKAEVVVFGNLGPQNNVPNDPIYFLNDSRYIGGSPDRNVALGFVTGSSSQLLSLTSVTVVCGYGTNNPSPTIELRTSSGTIPSETVISSWTIPNLPTQDILPFVLPSSGISLTPLTTYWVVIRDSNAVLGTPGTSQFEWYGYTPIIGSNVYMNPVTEQNGSGYSAYRAGFRRDGSDWTSDGPGGSIWAGTANLGLSLTVASVPEPSTYAMALAGLTCAAFGAWRRRRTSR